MILIPANCVYPENPVTMCHKYIQNPYRTYVVINLRITLESPNIPNFITINLLCELSCVLQMGTQSFEDGNAVNVFIYH